MKQLLGQESLYIPSHPWNIGVRKFMGFYGGGGAVAGGHETNRLIDLLLPWASNDTQIGSQKSENAYLNIYKGRLMRVRI